MYTVLCKYWKTLILSIFILTSSLLFIFFNIRNITDTMFLSEYFKNFFKYFLDYNNFKITNLTTNSTQPFNSLVFIFFFFFFFFFVNTLLTLFSAYVTFTGVLYLALTACLILLISLIFFVQQITYLSVIPFFELKIYSIYIPTFTNSIIFSLDYLSAAFMFLVVAIAIAAMLYARVYLFGDPNSSDFLIKLLWFVFSMLSLVLSKNFIFLYFSWEFIGITSMWLINFNSQRLDTNKSALKAFTFNKISDLCLFSALLLGAWIFNSPTITDWKLEIIANLSIYNDQNTYVLALSVLLAIAACIKSAQLGFHLWLPDSMDAPVPASALIHSATLVSAGIYLLLRFSDLFKFTGISELLCILGALTGAYGGVVAGMQTDLKRALAYSTISHCGFLFVASTLGGSDAALLYLFLHGFYKALSFICAGEAIRISFGYQDLNKMGGLFFLCPALISQFLIAMGNLCGLPFFIGYLFKSNFQFLLLTNSMFSVVIDVLLMVGLLSSLLYFCKVFYCVAFSYKKNNYKTYSEFFYNGFYKSTLPLKNPKILIFIFWFVLFSSLYCIYFLFNFKLKALHCSYLDIIQLNLGSTYLTSSDSLHTELAKLSYFFYFYILFIALSVVIWFSYIQYRCAGESVLSKFIFFSIFILLAFFFIM